MGGVAWGGMTRDQLGAAYNNGAAFTDSEERLAGWEARTARLRAHSDPTLLDRPYGPKPRNKIDIYRCGRPGAPLMVFVHGGYWMRNSKEVFGCMAEGPLARGIDVAMVGYTLAPQASLADIADEIRAAMRWLRDNNIATGKTILAGWSAGGHLASLLLTETGADAGLSISGLYELEPCRLIYVNDTLKLTAGDVEQLSPQRQLPRHSPPLIVAHGLGELPEFQRQARDYHAARRAAGLPSELLALDGHDHYSIMEELARPDGKLTAALERLAR
ncbi:MAG: alpha/beta hydrolase [Xanthobacteraceae bacterium]|uniref:alpha/beta hydrolase n=1 Tax=Pseudolabrys sp. TaxID=1960880 RepID=UPI003D0BBA37